MGVGHISAMPRADRVWAISVDITVVSSRRQLDAGNDTKRTGRVVLCCYECADDQRSISDACWAFLAGARRDSQRAVAQEQCIEHAVAIKLVGSVSHIDGVP